MVISPSGMVRRCTTVLPPISCSITPRGLIPAGIRYSPGRFSARFSAWNRDARRRTPTRVADHSRSQQDCRRCPEDRNRAESRRMCQRQADRRRRIAAAPTRRRRRTPSPAQRIKTAKPRRRPVWSGVSWGYPHGCPVTIPRGKRATRSCRRIRRSWTARVRTLRSFASLATRSISQPSEGLSRLKVGGTMPFLMASTEKIASTLPAAPRRWPIDDLVDDIDRL